MALGERCQQIGFVADKCRKVSKTYFIVKEKNKDQPGYHFHALLKLDKKPSRGWYKKNVHMYMKQLGTCTCICDGESVGEGIVNPAPSLTSITQNDVYEADGKLDEEYSMQQLDRMLATADKQVRHKKDLDRVVNYMFKEYQSTHTQYRDYVLVVGGKSQTL